MKLQFNRKKPRQIIPSLIYRASKFLFFTKRFKFKLFLDLNWIFWRLSIEEGVKVYGFSDQSMRRKNLDFLLQKLEPTFKVLDLGCRTGEISSIIAERTELVVGVDHDEKVINIANKIERKENLYFYHSDAYDYLLSNDNKFDVVILSHIIEHLDNPEDFLEKFKKFFQYFFIEIPDSEFRYGNQKYWCKLAE